jgi:N-acyl-L-homoserine lactone synthetase
MSTAAALAFSTPSFRERVSSLLDRVDYRLALTDADREDIFRLRYEAYLREGVVSPSFARRTSDRFDDLDNSWIFGVYIDGDLASSIRLTVADASVPELPAMAVFSDILEPQLQAGATVIDPTRFVADREMRRRYPKLPYVTIRIALMAAEFFRSDILLATVRTEHQAFYTRVLGHQVMAEARPYPGLTKPISMMGLDYLAAKTDVERRHPFFHSTHFERRALFQPGNQTQRKWDIPKLPAESEIITPAFARAAG